MSKNKSNTEEPSMQKRMRGIYLLPNLFTTGGLFAGYYAVVAAMKGFFDVAAVAIFIAMIADGLDGRVARLTNTQSDFGAQYDSLSDLVAFGLAPSLVTYKWSLMYLGKIGWLAAFCFAAAGALRLARFNTQTGLGKHHFQGLPIPSAAGILTSMVWTGNEFSLNGSSLSILVAFVSVITAILMVSNIRFYSFKELDFKGKVPFSVLIIVVLMFVLVAIDPPIVLFVCFIAYGLSGPIWKLNRNLKFQKKVRDKNQVKSDE